LSQAALEGKVPLRTFGELSALFAAKKTPAEAPPPAAAEAVPPPAPPVEVATVPGPEPAAEKHENSAAAPPS
jgi:hypothetical protein